MRDASAVTDRLVAPVGRSSVLLPGDDQAPRTVDWRGRDRGDALVMVRPGSIAEVVRLSVAAGIPVVPQGDDEGLCRPPAPSLATGRA
jgi:FAD/FMN-containing dehydrogenase